MKATNHKETNKYVVLRYEMDICSIQVDSHCMELLVVVVVSSRHVTDHLLVVHGLKDVVLPGAVVVACAGLDKHHLLLHD